MYRARAILFFVLLALTLMIYAPLVALAYPLPFAVAHRMSLWWCRFFVWLLRVIARIDVRVQGLENVPDRPCVFFARHQSALETLAFETFLPPYVWVIKREALWIPFFGWGLAGLRPIAIDRGARGKAVEQIKRQGIERLKRGLSVMIFPEGTRMPVGQTRRLGLGGAVLAVEAGVPAVPIALNSGVFWPARHLLTARPGTVDIVIGEPIETGDLDAVALTERLKGWIEPTVARLESDALEKYGTESAHNATETCR